MSGNCSVILGNCLWRERTRRSQNRRLQRAIIHQQTMLPIHLSHKMSPLARVSAEATITSLLQNIHPTLIRLVRTS